MLKLGRVIRMKSAIQQEEYVYKTSIFQINMPLIIMQNKPKKKRFIEKETTQEILKRLSYLILYFLCKLYKKVQWLIQESTCKWSPFPC